MLTHDERWVEGGGDTRLKHWAGMELQNGAGDVWAAADATAAAAFVWYRRVACVRVGRRTKDELRRDFVSPLPPPAVIISGAKY